MAERKIRSRDLPDPILFSDLRDQELAERQSLASRQLTLRSISPSKRPLTPEESAELAEVAGKLATDDIVDPLYRAILAKVAPGAGEHKSGLFPSQQKIEFARALFSGSGAGKGVERATKILDLVGLGDYPAQVPLASELAKLLPKLLGRFQSFVAGAPNPDDDFVEHLREVELAFDRFVATVAAGSSIADAQTSLVGVIGGAFDGATEKEFGTRLAKLVLDGRVEAAESLVDWLLIAAERAGADAIGSLTKDEKTLAGVYGLIEADSFQPPPYHAPGALPVYNPSEAARVQQFGKAVFSALGEYNTNLQLFAAVLPILVQLGAQGPHDTVSAKEWALVVRNLVERGVSQNEPQLARRVDEALNSIQNVGDNLAPSLIGIDLPDVDGATTILKDNIVALQPAYFASMFEEMKAFQVVDKLVELFQNGVLPIGRGNAGNALFKYWKDTAIRVSENERRSFYARTLGSTGGDDGDMPNREFNDLLLRFVSSVSWFVRQNNVDDLLRTKIPGSVSQQQVRKSGRDLAANLSLHGFGMAYFMATELQKQVKDAIAILSDPEIMGAYGSRDMWQVIDQVAATELGGARNSLRFRTMAASGAIIIAWLATHARELSSGSFESIIDIEEVRNPQPRRNGAKATTDPNDADLVNACEQWLAVTGTQEATIEDYSQRKESPSIPSKPIQIPAIARDLLESAGVPALGLSSNGYARSISR